jgi:chromosome partitioning protein
MEDLDMAVLVLGTPKGGAGKSTSSVLIGTTLAHRGAKVTIIDTDKNADLLGWYGKGQKTINVVGNVSEEAFISVLDKEASSNDLVIIDLAGAATTIMSRSILRADLVLIPMQPGALDAKHAARMVGLIQQEEQVIRRQIPFRIVMTRTSDSVPTKATRRMVQQMQANGLPFLATQVNQREPFRSLFELNCSLYDLDPKQFGTLPQAIDNAERLTDEVVETLKALAQKRTAA